MFNDDDTHFNALFYMQKIEVSFVDILSGIQRAGFIHALGFPTHLD